MRTRAVIELLHVGEMETRSQGVLTHTVLEAGTHFFSKVSRSNPEIADV